MCPMQPPLSLPCCAQFLSLAHFPGCARSLDICATSCYCSTLWWDATSLHGNNCTMTRALTSPWGTADILRIYTHDCLNTCVFPAATPSLGFHLLTFSLSLVKLLIDTPPARLLRSCQMSSDIEEYYANISGTHGVSMIWCQTGKHWSSSLTMSPSALPNRELWWYRRDCVIAAGSSTVMFFLKRKKNLQCSFLSWKFFWSW